MCIGCNSLIDCVLTGYNPAAYGGQPGMGQFPGSQYLNDPMTNMAMQYGQSLAGQSTEFVHKNVRHSFIQILYYKVDLLLQVIVLCTKLNFVLFLFGRLSLTLIMIGPNLHDLRPFV